MNPVTLAVGIETDYTHVPMSGGGYDSLLLARRRRAVAATERRCKSSYSSNWITGHFLLVLTVTQLALLNAFNTSSSVISLVSSLSPRLHCSSSSYRRITSATNSSWSTGRFRFAVGGRRSATYARAACLLFSPLMSPHLRIECIISQYRVNITMLTGGAWAAATVCRHRRR